MFLGKNKNISDAKLYIVLKVLIIRQKANPEMSVTILSEFTKILTVIALHLTCQKN